MRAALITIGQSPRPDITNDINDLLRGIDYVEYGALDRLSPEYIRRNLSPRKNEDFYITRISTGDEVKVSKNLVSRLIAELVKKIERSFDIIVIMCTGDFYVSTDKPLILPDKLVVKTVEALSPRNLGVIVPHRNQISMVRERWLKVADDLIITSWSPYTGNIEELKSISKSLSSRDLIVMDCMGYSRGQAKRVAELSGRPVLLPRLLVASLLKILLLP